MFITENSKIIKRGRIPKGFLSSNTAYMLVYKKVTSEKRINNTKKNKLKKLDTETNSNYNTMHEENIVIVKEKSVSLDEGKCKYDTISVSDVNNSEKMLKLGIETKQEMEISKVSENIVMEVSVREESTFDEQNGKHYEFDNKENQHDIFIKKSLPKVVKIDYKRLNGAAHRAMSCGERDFYEEVGILNYLF